MGISPDQAPADGPVLAIPAAVRRSHFIISRSDHSAAGNGADPICAILVASLITPVGGRA